ncbi:hypothetical protein AUEXF2481DRAFT_500521 [Aureobasidium subglaciale EXF-2481]|uniref:Uncharacterized protein n=1 Tax=Aureobasidium subglaciale (strain EXF-2481) TaxID=1043005 RepID=A0A074Y0N7_AURSE|nr:uncharacterized protein AUEXF2481DRAFT_500521 [Aureobasidium subglaciale EXF-2481]KEQ91363.1 hypothetical protein AUEXF2481DRAFT_500521 [Aureobasidium subglaciale EXF-2481]
MNKLGGRFGSKQSLEKTGTDCSGLDVDEVSELLSEERLNGREISNAIHTAGTLARYGDEKLQLSHIQEVLGVRRDFETALEKMEASTLGLAPGVGLTARQNTILTEEHNVQR